MSESQKPKPTRRRFTAEYKRRFGCEEFFSDMKARDFDVEKSRLRHAKRFERLLIVLVLLAFWLWRYETDRYSGT